MAQKSFGFTEIDYSYLAGSNISKCVGQRTTMPEKGKIIALRIKMAKQASTEYPIVWGMIWARPSGAILSQSPSSITPTNTYVSPNLATLWVYEFAMDGAVIDAGTSIWIGFSRHTAAGKAIQWGFQRSRSGQNTDEGNGAATGPTTFVTSVTDANETLYVEVVYQTGGEIKTFNGSGFVSKPVKVWNGSTWAGKPVKRWNGAAWVESNS